MSYYWFNRQEILQKAKERYNWYKNLSQEEKEKVKENQRKKYQQLIQYKKEALQNKWALFLLNIRMSERH